MKVVFLDHFGVMCLANPHGIVSCPDYIPRWHEMRIHGAFDSFDRDAVNILNEIIVINKVEIVVSSDWKYWSSIESMSAFYASQGIVNPPIDFTPNFHASMAGKKFQWRSGYELQQRRVMEIQAWLSSHDNVDRWVAVDDLNLGMFGLENFAWISRTDEGLKELGAKEKIVSYFL